MSKSEALVTKFGGGEVARRTDVPDAMSMRQYAPEVSITKSAAAVAVAERARALVQARHVMALHRPRDADEARSRLLRDCDRPGFAKTARWAIKNRGTGWTIRFAEAALRAWGNVDVESQVVTEDDERRIVRVSVVDLETNTAYSQDVVIDRTIERKKLHDGQAFVSRRLNSENEMVFLVPANEADLLQKTQAAISKAIRTLGLRHIPGDFLDDALARVELTKKTQGAADPDGLRKEIFDSFAGMGISPAALKKYVGQDVATCSPAQLDDLHQTFLALRDGHTTWAELLRQKAEEERLVEEAKSAGKPKPAAGPVDSATASIDDVVAAIAAAQQGMNPDAFATTCTEWDTSAKDWRNAPEATLRGLLGALQ